MPVRARSRASRSTRNAPASLDSARSSSSSRVVARAITPPSRTSAAGASAMRADAADRGIARGVASARSARSMQRSRAASSRSCVERGDERPTRAAVAQRVEPVERVAQAGEVARPRAAQRDPRRDAVDVGRAGEPRVQRTRLGARAVARHQRRRPRCARRVGTPRSRSGSCSQVRSSRLPMCVAHTSSRPNSVVGAGDAPRAPRRQALADLEVAARRAVERDVSSARVRPPARGCARACGRGARRRLVEHLRAPQVRSSAPAAPSAAVSSATPNAARSATPKCAQSARRPRVDVEVGGRRTRRRRAATAQDVGVVDRRAPASRRAAGDRARARPSSSGTFEQAQVAATRS